MRWTKKRNPLFVRKTDFHCFTRSGDLQVLAFDRIDIACGCQLIECISQFIRRLGSQGCRSYRFIDSPLFHHARPSTHEQHTNRTEHRQGTEKPDQ